MVEPLLKGRIRRNETRFCQPSGKNKNGEEKNKKHRLETGRENHSSRKTETYSREKGRKMRVVQQSMIYKVY